MGKRNQTERFVLIALLVALCVVLGMVDRTLSAALYPIRLGLANIIVLTALYYLNFYDSLLLVTLKNIITGLILGNPQIFIIGSVGTYLSYLVMYVLVRFGKKNVSTIGVSIAGAITHTIGQIIALTFTNFWLDTVAFSLLWLIPISIGTGVLVGIVTSSLKRYLDKGLVFKTIFTSKKDSNINSIIEENELK
ncbi:MAG: heptaprenyl diphosphate synthase [Haloplasmataceae bacterium]|jgi:heptaprenyl diphosphate synthase|nr:heptaprenyl diphosphate synthase [Haloplasmataceae bacterium]